MLDKIAARQHGVVSRAQATACGLTEEAIAARLRGGRWRRLFGGVYATFSGPIPRPSLLWAAVLRAGPGAVLSHESAAELAGLLAPGDAPSPAVHVTIPAARRLRSIPGVVVHRSRRTAAIQHPTRTPPQTRVEETVLDLACTARDLDQAVGWLARACGRRLTTAIRIRRAMAARSRMRWRVELATALGDVAAGCHSPLELRYLRDVERRHGLPRGVRQWARSRRGGRWYDDVSYDEFRTLVELDGRIAHPDGDRWRDMARDNAGVASGRSVLRYGSADVTARACATARQVATVLRRNGWLGVPVACGPGCAVTADRGKLPGL
ncbi:MAG TPA: type IV toxin-antitoxin system AbiEi family antitoxin domain-containing protein [Pilimelia sp.]|nr:type IV toxin-antitoxin system AbiEi family antitoxin domain-containing protein [Pilimelia sp.]